MAVERALPADRGKHTPPRANIHQENQQLRQSLVSNSAFLSHLSISFYLRSNVAQPGRGNLVIDKASGLSRFLRRPLLRVQASDDYCANHSSANAPALALVHQRSRTRLACSSSQKWWITGPSIFEINEKNFWLVTSLVRRPFHWLLQLVATDSLLSIKRRKRRSMRSTLQLQSSSS